MGKPVGLLWIAVLFCGGCVGNSTSNDTPVAPGQNGKADDYYSSLGREFEIKGDVTFVGPPRSGRAAASTRAKELAFAVCTKLSTVLKRAWPENPGTGRTIKLRGSSSGTG